MGRISWVAAIQAATVFFAIVAVLYIISALWRDVAAPEDRGSRPLSQFALKDYRGEEVTEKDFFGKPALVYVWASWCPLCAEGLADFAEIKREFGDAVAVVAINRAESPEIARRFSASEGGMATGTVFLLDPDDGYYRAIGGFAMPETIFADREGTIHFHKRGPISMEEIRRRIYDLGK